MLTHFGVQINLFVENNNFDEKEKDSNNLIWSIYLIEFCSLANVDSLYSQWNLHNFLAITAAVTGYLRSLML